MTDGRCTAIVRRGDTWHPRDEPCGKPAKGTLANGSPACGLHIRQEAGTNARAAARASEEALRDRVKQALGIDFAMLTNDYMGHPALTIPLADLEQALRAKGLLSDD